MFNFPAREEGQGLVEYALVLVLVAVAVILILTVLGSSIVLVYARVVGGFNGQSISNSGTEYIVLSADVSVSGGPGGCNVTISDATVAVVNEGALLENSSTGTIAIQGGGRSGTLSAGTTNNVGIADGLGGSLSGAACPSTLEIGNTGYSSPMNP